MPVRLIEKCPSAYDYQLLIKHLLKPPLQNFPKKKIIYRDIFEYDYIGLSKRIAQLANLLKTLGINQGDKVAVMDWDSHRYLECFFAVPMYGAVLHTVNPRLSPEQVLYTINHAEDDVLIMNSDFLPLIEAVKDKLKTVKKIVLLTDLKEKLQTSMDFAGEYEEMLKLENDFFDFPDFSEDAMATIFYTTGTTGLPKGVCFSHRHIVLHTYGVLSGISSLIKSQTKFDSEDVYMPLTPMFHVHAWGLPYLSTMAGLKQVYPGRYEPEMIMKLILTHKVTFSHCVPTIIHMLVSNPLVKQFDLSNWQVVVGGSALPKSLCKAALDLGLNIYNAYGMSETCPLLTGAFMKPHMLEWDKEEQVKIRSKTGLTVPLVDLRIIDTNGNDVPKDGKTDGEIIARSPWLTQAYFKEPEKSEELWKDGWLHTGDVGNMDSDGYVQITDRFEDIIKTGGEWVSSLEIEDLLLQHEAVNEAAVISVIDEKWGERPLAFLVLHHDFKEKFDNNSIKSFLMKFVENGKIPKYAIPDKIEIVDEILKTSVGKINKKELRKKFFNNN